MRAAAVSQLEEQRGALRREFEAELKRALDEQEMRLRCELTFTLNAPKPKSNPN